MLHLKSVLFATDFSPCANEARRYAIEFCRRCHAEMHVLHVVHDLASEAPQFGMGLAFPAYLENVGGRRRQLEEAAISSLANEVDTDCDENDFRVILATRFGTPFVEIIKYAREHFVDLIIVGTHGRTGVGHALMGSVAERVVRKAGCPVLTIRDPG